MCQEAITKNKPRDPGNEGSYPEKKRWKLQNDVMYEAWVDTQDPRKMWKLRYGLSKFTTYREREVRQCEGGGNGTETEKAQEK